MVMTKKAKIVALRARGFSYQRIADECDCCVGYVNAALQRHRCGGARPTDIAWYERQERQLRQLRAQPYLNGRKHVFGKRMAPA